jgi:hypothetical protein
MTLPANYVRPLLLVALVGSLAWAIVQLIRSFIPDGVDSFVIVLCMVAALEGIYSGHLIKAQKLHGSDIVRFHIIELIGLALLLKLPSLFGPLQSMVVRFLTLDFKTFLGGILLLVFWVTGLDTGQDLAELNAPPMPVERVETYVSPAQRLRQRFFVGGIFLLIVTGILNFRPVPVGGLVLNVLIYFGIGLLYLSQIRLDAARREWQSLGLTASAAVTSPWLRFAAILIGLAALVAFVLPTQYMLGLLDTLHDILTVIAAFAAALAMLFAWVITLPLRLLMGQPAGQPDDIVQPPSLPPQMQSPVANGPDLWSLLPKLFLLVVMGYIIVSYLRDNPELLAILRNLRIFAFLREFWAMLRRRAGNFGMAFRMQLPKSLPNLRRRRGLATAQRYGFVRLNALSPRERIHYFYLSTVRRAQEQGISRTPDQTPYEYQEVLAGELTDAKVDVSALTQAFVEARYSPDPVDAEKARHTKTHWQQLRRALQHIKRQTQLK